MAAPLIGNANALHRPEIAHHENLVLVRHLPGLALVLADFYPAAFAVEGKMIAFDRHKSVQGIGDLDPALVKDGRAHRVGNVDVFAEHAGVAEIAVLLRRLLVEHIEPGVAADVEVEGADLRIWADLAAG